MQIRTKEEEIKMLLDNLELLVNEILDNENTKIHTTNICYIIEELSGDNFIEEEMIEKWVELYQDTEVCIFVILLDIEKYKNARDIIREYIETVEIICFENENYEGLQNFKSFREIYNKKLETIKNERR